MADNQTKVDAEKARIVQEQLGANAPALQGLEFDLPQYKSPLTEMQAQNIVESGNSILDRVSPQPQQIVAPSSVQTPATAISTQPEVVTPEQLQLVQQQVQPTQVQPQQPNLGALSKASKALKQAADVGSMAAAQENAYVDGYQKTVQEFEAKQEAERQARQKEIDDKITSAQEEVEKLSSGEIDPNRVFSSMSTAQKFGTAILLGIAGNRGAETLDRMVRMDVAAQEKSMNSRVEAAKGKVSMLQEFRNKLKDDFLAKEALKASMYQVAQLKLGAIQSQTRNAQVAANIQTQIADIELKKQEIVQRYADRASQLVAQQQLQAIDPVTAKIQMLPESAQKPLLEAKEVYDSTQAAFKTIDSIFDESKGIGAIEGNIPFSEKKAQVEANAANIESAIRATMKGQGTIQESEIERLVKPLLPLPSDSIARIDIKKQKLKQLLMTKNAGQIGRLQNMGLLPKEFSPSSAKKN